MRSGLITCVKIDVKSGRITVQHGTQSSSVATGVYGGFVNDFIIALFPGLADGSRMLDRPGQAGVMGIVNRSRHFDDMTFWRSRSAALALLVV